MSSAGARADVTVLGGGFLGLSASYRLAKAGCRVRLLEASPHAGGVSSSFQLGGFTIDRFYHTILPTDRALLDLLAELGLADRVAWRRVRTGFFRGGRQVSVSTPLELLRFPVLRPEERLRLIWTLLRAQRGTRLADVEPLTCEEWLVRTGGRSVYEKLWRPLLKAKLGDAAPRVSASFIWATMQRLTDARAGGRMPRTDTMGFLQGGYEVAVRRLVERLGELGTEIRTNEPVRRLTERPDGWEIETSRDRIHSAAVVSAVPFPLLQGWLGITPQREQAIEYLGVVVEVLLLRRPLGPFYIMNLGEEDFVITGVIETTNLAPAGYFQGGGLVYLPRYVLANDAIAAGSDAEISARFRRDLARVYPDFRDDWVEASSVQRAPLVQPVHTCDYRLRIPPIRIAPRLWVASSAQVHPWPLNNDRIVRQAERVANDVLTDRAASDPVPQPERAAGSR